MLPACYPVASHARRYITLGLLSAAGVGWCHILRRAPLQMGARWCLRPKRHTLHLSYTPTLPHLFIQNQLTI